MTPRRRAVARHADDAASSRWRSAVVLTLAGCASTARHRADARRWSTPAALGADAAAPAAPRRAPTGGTASATRQLDDLVDQALAGIAEPARRRRRALARAAANVDVARMPPTGRRSNGALDVTRQRFTENGIYPPPLAGSIADDRARCS